MAVSVPPQAWLVEAIGGEWVEVVALVGPGDSAETYQPTDAQVSRVLASRIYFRGGVPFEEGSWFEALSSAPGLKVVDLRKGLRRGPDALPMASVGDYASDPHASHSHANDTGGEPMAVAGVDPHLWLSPRRLLVQAGTVTDALVKADPWHEAEYARNFETTMAQLIALDQALALRLAPYAGRSFYVFHPAWGYLAMDYGLYQVAIEGGGKSPSDSELTRLQEDARRDRVAVIFVQPQVPHRAADAVASAVGATTESLDPLAPDLPANLRHAADRIAASFASGKADSPAPGSAESAGDGEGES